MSLDPILSLTCRAAFALLFGAALAHKLADLQRFKVVLDGHLRGLGTPILPPIGVTVALVLVFEGMIVATCLYPGAGRLAATMTGSVLICYAVSIALNLAGGNTHLDCGCHWGKRHPISHNLVWRNLLLAITASTMAFPVSDRALGSLDFLSILAGVAVSALLYSAVAQIIDLNASARSDIP